MLLEHNYDPALITGGFILSNEVAAKYSIKTASYSIQGTTAGNSQNNDGTIEQQTSGTTVTLPTAVGNQGITYVIKNTSGGTVTLATTSNQTIFTSSAVTSITLQSGDSYTVQSNGTNWIAI